MLIHTVLTGIENGGQLTCVVRFDIDISSLFQGPECCVVLLKELVALDESLLRQPRQKR